MREMSDKLRKMLPEKKDNLEFYCRATLPDGRELAKNISAHNMVNALQKFSAMHLNSKIDYKSVFILRTESK